MEILIRLPPEYGLIKDGQHIFIVVDVGLASISATQNMNMPILYPLSYHILATKQKFSSLYSEYKIFGIYQGHSQDCFGGGADEKIGSARGYSLLKLISF